MHVMTSLAIAATALLDFPADAAVLTGNVKVRGAACQGVKLIPRTAESERAIAAMYGTLAASSVVLSEQQATSSGKSIGKDTACGGWTASYRFNKVAPGDYFLTAALVTVKHTPNAGRVFGEQIMFGPSSRTRTYLMQPVRVTGSDRVIEVNFRR